MVSRCVAAHACGSACFVSHNIDVVLARHPPLCGRGEQPGRSLHRQGHERVTHALLRLSLPCHDRRLVRSRDPDPVPTEQLDGHPSRLTAFLVYFFYKTNCSTRARTTRTSGARSGRRDRSAPHLRTSRSASSTWHRGPTPTMLPVRALALASEHGSAHVHSTCCCCCCCCRRRRCCCCCCCCCCCRRRCLLS
eukprot:COSAG01_NODE_3301_length_6295_cov_20.275823_4_plen_193_part_00